jgi:hypothetical protein
LPFDLDRKRNVQETPLVIDGVDVSKIRGEDLQGLLDADDEILIGKLGKFCIHNDL